MAMADKGKCDMASLKDGDAWGTLEELLLACAISRYGTRSWESVASVVQKVATSRSSTCMTIGNSFSKAFSPHDCQQRYRALNCRFDADGDNYDLPVKLQVMIDELKRLRVEELRREVERYDVSIKSLQSKVKRLEEERGRSSEEEADLGTGVDRGDAGVEYRGREQQDGSTAANKQNDESGDRSLNESNWTTHNGVPARKKKSNRIQKPKTKEKFEPDPVRSALDSKPNKKVSAKKVVGRPSQSVRVGKPAGLRGKENGSFEEAMQSSDVQSSANLSVTKRRGRRRNKGVWSCSNDVEVEKSTPANMAKEKAQPLIKFLEMVRSHKHGSVFHRRLPTQKTQKYKNLIRQHIDIETIESKLERGVYSESNPAFYRDLLLVFTNALLFFSKSSTEHLAARELRKLVIKQIGARVPTPVSGPSPDTDSKRSPDILVCRRRRRNNNNASKTEEPENNNNGGLKAEPSARKDVPMKVKRGRTSSSSAANDASSSVMSSKRRKEGAAEFVKRINRDLTTASNEEESKKKMKTTEEAPSKGRRFISTTSKNNPRK